jgi:hypothetical protein
MNTITIEKANEVIREVKRNGELMEQETLSHSMKKEVYKEDGWTYEIFTDHDKPLKIEAYNHRELIEAYVR